MARSFVPDSDQHGVAKRRRSLFASAAITTGFAAPATNTPRKPVDTATGANTLPRPTHFVPAKPAASRWGRTATSWHFLCLAEVDNFTQLRRHLGTQRAERLVLDIADRIDAQLPHLRMSAVGRAAIEFSFDGDDIAQLDSALNVIRAAFEGPIDLDGESHVINLVVAAAAAPVAEVDDVRLVEEAEAALTVARAEQRVVIRDLSSGTPASDRLTLMRDLGGALANDEMFIQYQPKVHVRRQKIVSAEALVRWQHPTRGLILPGDFIPAAEDSRGITALTLWTLDQVIADQRKLAARGHHLEIFVNISGQLLGDARFVANACDKVRESGARIGFEITETSVIRDPETAIAHLQRFADIGIAISIDDYGAGLSSLAYLKQLPARELKIDKMFVLKLTSSNRDPLIVRSTIDLAHALEMEVTAEGVETQAALALLTVMGCDLVQGFLISRPLSIDAFMHFLDDGTPLFDADSARSFNRPPSFWKSA